eukprot:m.22244 g.22244  ORF g.22244 m.22244 type:complete len:226 (-) comp5439_c0_seq1:679-1356(-)
MITTTTIVEKKDVLSSSSNSNSPSASSHQRQHQPPHERRGVILGVMGGMVAFGIGLLWPFLQPALRKSAPFIPTTPFHITKVAELVKGNGCKRFADLGSGDGRIVINVAKHAEVEMAVGVEMNPWLVLYSRIAAFKGGVGSHTKFKNEDVWKTDCREFDSIVVFGVSEMMDGLYSKLNRELLPGSLIMSCQFPFKGASAWKTFEKGNLKLWVYRIGRETKAEAEL